jgi:hypothetical protein
VVPSHTLPLAIIDKISTFNTPRRKIKKAEREMALFAYREGELKPIKKTLSFLLILGFQGCTVNAF